MTLLIYQRKLQTGFQTSHLCRRSFWLNVKSARSACSWNLICQKHLKRLIGYDDVNSDGNIRQLSRRKDLTAARTKRQTSDSTSSTSEWSSLQGREGPTVKTSVFMSWNFTCSIWCLDQNGGLFSTMSEFSEPEVCVLDLQGNIINRSSGIKCVTLQCVQTEMLSSRLTVRHKHERLPAVNWN